MRSKERVKLTNREWFNHFGLTLILIVLLVIFTLYSIYDAGINQTIIPLLILPAVLIFLYWGQWKKLFFQEFIANMTSEQLSRAIKITARELSWDLLRLEENYAQAIRPSELYGFQREKITIKKTANKILINSMADPDLSRNGHSRKRNKENTKYFLINAANILKGKDVEKLVRQRLQKKEDDFWNKPEWTIGSIIKRVVGYGWTVIFLVLGIVFLKKGEVMGVLLIGLILFICFIYIKNDIAIIREKQRRNRLNQS